MKFSWKIFISTFLVVLLSFGVGGYFLVSTSFYSGLQRELANAQEENRMLQTLLAIQLGNTEEEGGADRPSMVQGGMDAVEGQMGGTLIRCRVSMPGDGILYENVRFLGIGGQDGKELAESLAEDEIGCRVGKFQDSYLIQCAAYLLFEEEPVLVETFRDVSQLFLERREQFSIFRSLVYVVGAVSGIGNFFIALWLTDPVTRLSRATRRFASGDLHARAQIPAGDEIGQLAADFNHMADRIEGDIHKLEEINLRQEDFIGSFAHEMKTPLTSIIGYADMLRSWQLEDKDRFQAANYIFSEGKRLEALSQKLLELILVGNEKLNLAAVEASDLLKEVEGMLRPLLKESGVSLKGKAEKGMVTADRDLLKTVLVNVIDNGRKAIDGPGSVTVVGKREEGGYAFYVRDTGKGIPPEELGRITEAFYMVDKSRSRAKGGAGLGLAICQEIVRLHRGTMEFRSTVGEGTTVRIFLGAREAGTREAERQEAGAREAERREAGTREAERREAGTREAERREAGGQKRAQRE